MTDLSTLSLLELAAGLEEEAFTSEQVVTAHLAAIEALNPALGAVWDVDTEGAIAAARASDVRRAAGSTLSDLDGLPVGVKDNIDVAGRPTTNGLATSWVPQSDAEVVVRLKQAGAIPLAKLAMHEAALGATSDNPHRGRVENPILPGHTPGGSSGGSAAAVAAGLVPVALGTDTLGSVRIPAAYCGVAGFKPSYELIPTTGVTPLSWTLDHVGPIARSVADIALTLPVLAGVAADEVLLDGLVLGWPMEVGEFDPGVKDAVAAALEQLKSAGVSITPVDLHVDDLSAMRRAALLAIEAEGAVALEAVWTADPNALSEGLRKMLAYGRDAPAARYVKAYRAIEDTGAAINTALETVDALILPTAPQTAFAWDAPVPVNQADLTSLANYAGAPIGLQLVGGYMEDAALMGTALAVEDCLRVSSEES
jgi:aspartyl-tRNA(Asn)/glutamyl-tRNA(Gln) amidotransferase subunit A